MQHSNLKQTPVKVFAIAALCLTVFTLTAKAGIDSYEIYLNNKLILKQSAAQPLNFKGLQLNKSNSNDQLVIYYFHCNTMGKAGKGRSIAIKDGKGNTLKEWKFADATGSNTGMVIPVKELLQLANNNSNGPLSLYYAAQERPKEQMLTSFYVGEKSTAYHYPERRNARYRLQ